MTIIHAQSVIASGGSSEFAPTILGRIAATGVVSDMTAYDLEIEPSQASADADTGLWVLRTGGDVYIRVGGNASPPDEENWYNEAGVDQGNPGTQTSGGTVIFQLNEDVDSVNIYAAALDTIIFNSPAFFKIGTYTDDDKSTFFLPTNDVKYGRQCTCESQGSDNNIGDHTIQVTFRKTGKDDLTVSFRSRTSAEAETEAE